MNQAHVASGLFERLSLRWQGKYPGRILWLAQALTLPAILPGVFYLGFSLRWSALPIRLMLAIFAPMTLLGMALLAGYGIVSTRNARAVIAGKQAASATAWQEMATLPGRFSLVFVLANLLVVDVPLLVGVHWLGGVTGRPVLHVAIACLLATAGWTVFLMLLLDRALVPLQGMLGGEEPRPPDFGLRWKTRLYFVPVALVGMAALLLGGIGYQRLVDLSEAGAQEAYLLRLAVWQWGGAGVLALLLALLAAGLLVDALRRPLEALQEALLASHERSEDFLPACYGSGEVSGLAWGMRTLWKRAQALRQRAEASLQLSRAEVARQQARLQLVARIGRLALLPQDIEAFLQQAVRTLASHYYHAGLLWLEEDGRTLTLRVAAMMDQRSPLSPGQTVAVERRTAVGAAAYLGRPFLANEIRQERALQSEITLAGSGAELAVPIRAGGRIVAVLDLQSERARDFTEEDVEAAEAIAAQIALVIQNQRLDEDRRAALRQVNALTAQSVRQAWESRVRRQRRGYRYTPAGLVPADRTEKPAAGEAGNRLEIPVTLRGQKIGVIALARKEDIPWSEADRALATEIAEQVALALENARLLAEAQQRAAQEQMIGELTTRFSRSLEPEVLLQTAVSELKRLPNVREVSVFIQPSEAGNGAGRRATSQE